MRKLLVVLVVLGLGFAGCLGGDDGDDGTSFNGREYNPPVEAVDFTLTDQDGNAVSFSDFDGKVIVVAFTYTHCPDVCPVIEANMKYMKGELGDSYGEDVVYLSISIDPLRDTPEVLAQYVENNGYDWAHLTSDDYEMIKGVWSDWGVAVNTTMIDAHVAEEMNDDMDMHDGHDMGDHMDMTHTFSVMMPDNSTTSVDMMSSHLPAMNGWRLTEAGMNEVGVEFNYTDDPLWGHFLNDVAGFAAPADNSWWWGLYLWNESSGVWEESDVGIDDVLLNESAHIAWAPSDSNLSLLPEVGENHTFALLMRDNVTLHVADVTHMDLSHNAWDLTVSGMAAAEIDFNYTLDPSLGHHLNNISGIDAPSDGSWWWSMNIWNESSEAWEASTLGMDSLMLAAAPHLAWAPSNANLSLLLAPTAEECDGNGWVMGEGSVAHCMCDDGYQWDGDDHLSCVMGEGQGAHDGHDDEEASDVYNVGHSTVTFIVDKDGNKRVAWVGSDWDADEFLEDIRSLV